MMDSQLKITCTTFGKTCPELMMWRSNNEKTNFEPCFPGNLGQKKLPPIRCRPYELPNREARIQVEDMVMEKTCWIEERKSYIQRGTNCTDIEGKEDCDANMWSHQWVENSSPDPNCNSRGDAWYKFRFCRKSQRCVIMEVEMKYLNREGECADDDVKDDHRRDIKDNCNKRIS